MNSRDVFKKTMRAANTGRPIFVPIIYCLAAKIDQTSLSEMVMNPTSYANILESTWKLLRHDAIISGFDTSLEMEVFGCQVEWQDDYGMPVVSGWTDCELPAASLESSERLPVLLEAVKRLIQTQGREVAVIGVITGPCSLAGNIAANAVSDQEYPFEEIIVMVGTQLAKYARDLGEVKVDAIIVREDLLGEKYYEEFLAHEKAYSDVYTTLLNLTRFYNLAGLLMVKGGKLEDLAVIVQKINPGGLILTSQELDESGLNFLQQLSNSQKLAVGLPLPLDDPDRAAAQLNIYEDYVSKFKPGGFFYTSDGEIPPNINLENLRSIAGRIKGISAL